MSRRRARIDQKGEWSRAVPVHRERGASAVELAIAALLLVPLVLGIADFGMLWQKRQTTTSAARAGARMAASSCLVAPNTPTSTCVDGNRITDDYRTLLALRAVLGPSVGEVDRVIIYKPTNADGSPPAQCLGLDVSVFSTFANSFRLTPALS